MGRMLSFAWRAVKGAFRMIGLDLRRYVPPAPPRPPSSRLTISSPAGMDMPKRPAPFVLVSSNHGTLIVNRNDYYAKNERVAFGVGHQILNTSSFDPTEVRLALAILSKRRETRGDGVVAVDCGANIGVHTVEWARYMHGWGRVTAIEAQERIYYSLCGNIAINNCLNASAILAAAGAKRDKLQIPVPDYERPASFGSLELRGSKTNEFIGQQIDYSREASATVDMITIDELNLERLDFLKIDVEGMEMEVFSGATQTIAKCKPAMIIEVLKSNPSDIAEFLDAHGYKYYAFADNFLAFHQSDPLNADVSVIQDVPTIRDRSS